MGRARFRSKTEHNLDAKGRLNFPSRFRDVLRELGPDQLMIAPWNDHLRAYPLAEWERLETILLEQGAELGDFVRYVVGGVVECTLDKQGRIILPPALRTAVDLGQEVVLTGMLDWVEIWNKETWDVKAATTRENFAEHKAKLAKLGIFS
ncbi:MAG: division/cell wall cluster transcriptional repressor MraZ [Desulfotalea sp.]|nr:MAG: division/cell wall cluster transcriptional repressor MraZ [Desulfotalea sp.]